MRNKNKIAFLSSNNINNNININNINSNIPLSSRNFDFILLFAHLVISQTFEHIAHVIFLTYQLTHSPDFDLIRRFGCVLPKLCLVQLLVKKMLKERNR